MRHLLLALPLALLSPILTAQEHEHASLRTHEHGVAILNLALDGQILELNLESPAMNLIGFEHAPHNEEERARVAALRAQLEQPLELVALPAAAACTLAAQELEGRLFAEHEHDHGHSDIRASYRLTCAHPERLEALDLAAFFARFPATHRLAAQLIGPAGQRGAELTPDNPRLLF
ncbi:DUF2796 domain-containing protein [Zestomonas thermotolerans]|uniref:DUF2796 domain-containing protein n=1 Tax=Zestomonas thermotolerans TaxID=157784 RepID=UPI000366DCD5|nr:DUF2796 domain-containing protein [Pseudomonas thermotolerans]